MVKIWAPPFFAKFTPVSYLDVLVHDDSFQFYFNIFNCDYDSNKIDLYIIDYVL